MWPKITKTVCIYETRLLYQTSLMKNLTLKQKNILDFVAETLKGRGSAPTIREIGQRFRLSSTATIYNHLRALVKKGYLDKEKSRARSIYPKGLQPPEPGSTMQIPLLSGFVHAGPAHEIVEDVERTIHVDRFLLRTRDSFALRVKGISMTGAGIMEGDIVIVRRQATADDGDIVIALKDGEATLKRYVQRKDGVLLKAENPRSKSIFIAKNDDDQRMNGIVGKVIQVVRNLK